MSKKFMVVALAAISAVLFALPAVASGAEWKLSGGAQNFTGATKEKTTLTTNQNETVTCSEASGAGSVNAAGTGGTIELTFHGCVEDTVGTTCTTTGQSSGTITTTTLDWTSVYLTANKTKPGIKIEGTGPSGEKHGHIASFKCGFGLVSIVVEGSVVGEVVQPCGTKAKEFSVLFESTAHGVQKYMQNTATGEKTDLTATRNGVARTASQDGTGKLNLTKEATLECI